MTCEVKMVGSTGVPLRFTGYITCDGLGYELGRPRRQAILDREVVTYRFPRALKVGPGWLDGCKAVHNRLWDTMQRRATLFQAIQDGADRERGLL